MLLKVTLEIVGSIDPPGKDGGPLPEIGAFTAAVVEAVIPLLKDGRMGLTGGVTAVQVNARVEPHGC